MEKPVREDVTGLSFLGVYELRDLSSQAVEQRENWRLVCVTKSSSFKGQLPPAVRQR